MTYFPLLVVAVFLKRKYSHTNISGVDREEKTSRNGIGCYTGAH